jgi:hypothetical protein
MVAAGLAAAGHDVASVPALVEAALAGPPPPLALVVVADAGLAPTVAARLLELPGERPAVAVAELAGGLLAAGRHGPGALVAERLAADTRSVALQEWAGGAAAAGWRSAGEVERADQWAAWAARQGPPSS